MSGRVIVLTQGSGTQPVPEQIQTMPVPGKGTRPTATPPTAMELQAGTPVIVDPACESLPSSHESFCSFKDCQFFKWLCFKPARTPCDGCCRTPRLYTYFLDGCQDGHAGGRGPMSGQLGRMPGGRPRHGMLPAPSLP